MVRSLWRDNHAGIAPNSLDSELLPPAHDVTIVGNVMPVERARRLGREVAEELRDAGVQAVLLTAT